MRLTTNWILDGAGGSTPAPCRLMSGRVLRLDRARGSVLCCLQGTAWITEDGSIADIVLEPGQRHVVERMDAVVVMGLPSCEIVLRRAAAPRARVSWRWRRPHTSLATQPGCCAPAERLRLV